MQNHCKTFITNYSFLKSSHLLRDGGNFNFKKLKSMGRVDIFIHEGSDNGNHNKGSSLGQN